MACFINEMIPALGALFTRVTLDGRGSKWKDPCITLASYLNNPLQLGVAGNMFQGFEILTAKI